MVVILSHTAKCIATNFANDVIDFNYTVLIQLLAWTAIANIEGIPDMLFGLAASLVGSEARRALVGNDKTSYGKASMITADGSSIYSM